MKAKTEGIPRIEVTMDEVVGLLERAKGALAGEDYQILEKLVGTLVYLTNLLEKQGITIQQLRKILFGIKSEKLSKILDALETEKSPLADDSPSEGNGGSPSEEAGGGDPPSASDEKKEQDDGAPKAKRKGHGRNPADAYKGAEQVFVPHETLKPGYSCPNPGCRGKVYELRHPKVLVRIVGRAPIGAKVTRLQQLRCNLCLTVFTAKVPEDVGPEKYDETAASMMSCLRYGNGFPLNRLEGLQEGVKIPLPASTQWDVVERAFRRIAPAHEELIRQAAQGDVLHNDDTPMKVLEIMKENKAKKEKKDDG